MPTPNAIYIGALPCFPHGSSTPSFGEMARLHDQLARESMPANAETLSAYEGRLLAIVAAAPSEKVRTFGRVGAYQNISAALEKIGRIQEALSYMSMAAQLVADPSDTDHFPAYKGLLHLNWATMLLRANLVPQAIAPLEGAYKFGAADRNISASKSSACEFLRRTIERLYSSTVAPQIIADAERRGAAVEGRDDWRAALEIYVAALTSIAPRELPPTLTQKAVAAGAKITPLPPIPESARKHAVFAQTAFKDAKTKEKFSTAREHYTHALALAPWWADAWVTLSAVHEQLGDFDVAATDLENYLRAAPQAADRDKVQNKIYELQYKAKRENR